MKNQKKAESFSLQKLEFYLRDSGLIYRENLRKVLGDDGHKQFQSIKSTRKNGFSSRTLARLAKFSTRHVESLALRDLGISFNKKDEKRYTTSGKSWLFNFAIFDSYAKKDGSSLEVSAYLFPETNNKFLC